MSDAGLPKEVRICSGPVFSSVVEYGISSDRSRYRNVMGNVTDSRHLREICVTGVRGRMKAKVMGGGSRSWEGCTP